MGLRAALEAFLNIFGPWLPIISLCVSFCIGMIMKKWHQQVLSAFLVTLIILVVSFPIAVKLSVGAFDFVPIVIYFWVLGICWLIGGIIPIAIKPLGRVIKRYVTK